MLKVISGLIVVMLVSVALSTPAAAAVEGADGRIKTMVYSNDEVYTVLAKYGFNTTIEISTREKIEAISVGDSVGWQISTVKNRIFIKPLIRNATTNLSIITNKRSYQIELIVSSGQVKNVSHAYVVKFFYPDEQGSYVQPEPKGAGYAPPPPMAPAPAPIMPEPVAPSGSAPMAGLPSLGGLGIQAYNFNYTLTGPDALSPVKIFDDGNSTYFEYPAPLSSVPQVAVVLADGSESIVSVRTEGSKYVVNSVAAKFVIRNYSNPNELVCIFNESMGRAASIPPAM